ncbi:membrane protein insertase YidC [Betaproteobacteria bacterium GR16-43]|nr:membrane protein insertase YidC [Betaproteobacteria bacterium GR16-43]
MDTQRLIAFVVFSFSALLLWDAWQKHNAPKPPPPGVVASSVPTATSVPVAPTAANPTPAAASPAAALGVPVSTIAVTAATGEVVLAKTDLFDVELNTQGGDIRRVTLKKVFSALDRNKPLTLLEPNPQHFFVTQSGLLGEGAALPTHKTTYVPEAKSYALADGKDAVEVKMTARDAAGVEVTKRYVFKRGTYEIDVYYDIKNGSDKPVANATAYYQFLRDNNQPSQEAAQTSSFAGVATFTGPAVYTEATKFQKVDFKDIEKGKQSHPKESKDGWIAVIQHYFVSAWAPKAGTDRTFFTRHIVDNLYTVGVTIPVGTIAAGATATTMAPLYIGPQETEKLEKIAPGLDLVVDYGWLHILAAPLFWLLKSLHALIGNWGWSIIALTVLIKAVFYPLNAKAGRSMASMKVLAPKMEKLKELYGDDRQKLNQAMMELYRTEKINPVGGCLPIVVQIPVFIALYWVLLASIELRHAPWLGWIQDLSAPDPYFVLPVIYAISMFVQTKLNPAPADPVQAKVMLVMPIMFSVFFLFFPSGLVLYWVVQNLIGIAQQWHINRTLEREAKAKAKR